MRFAQGQSGPRGSGEETVRIGRVDGSRLQWKAQEDPSPPITEDARPVWGTRGHQHRRRGPASRVVSGGATLSLVLQDRHDTHAIAIILNLGDDVFRVHRRSQMALAGIEARGAPSTLSRLKLIAIDDAVDGGDPDPSRPTRRLVSFGYQRREGDFAPGLSYRCPQACAARSPTAIRSCPLAVRTLLQPER